MPTVDKLFPGPRTHIITGGTGGLGLITAPLPFLGSSIFDTADSDKLLWEQSFAGHEVSHKLKPRAWGAATGVAAAQLPAPGATLLVTSVPAKVGASSGLHHYDLGLTDAT